MRVSCFFVSAAIMLAQQSMAAPIVGLPTLPVLSHEGPLVYSASNTVQGVPIIGDLTVDLLESESEGNLLSTSHLTGQGGLVNEQSNVGQITRSLQRRQSLPLLRSVGTLTNGMQGTPLLGSPDAIAPVTQGLTSKVGGLNGALPDIHGLTHQTTSSLSLNPSVTLSSILKRDGFPGFGSLLDVVPGIHQISSIVPITSMPVGALGAIPGVASIQSLGSAMPVPGLAKRNEGIPALGSLPGLSSVGQLTHMPAAVSVPGMNTLASLGNLSGEGSKFPGSLPGLGQLSSLTSALPIGSLLKRDNNLQSLPIISKLPVVGGLPAMPGMSSMPSVPSMSPMSSMPSMPNFPGMASMPSSSSVPGSISSLPVISSVPVIGGLTSGLPGLSSITSIL